MKQSILKLAIPLTIISFLIISKWWYVIVVDGPNEILTGFPLPFVCNGWHTSMSLQIFISELIIDLMSYFIFWTSILFCFNRFVKKIIANKIITIGLYGLAGLITFGALAIAANPDNVFSLKRTFGMDVMETGCKFIWQNVEKPDFYKYPPEQKKQ